MSCNPTELGMGSGPSLAFPIRAGAQFGGAWQKLHSLSRAKSSWDSRPPSASAGERAWLIERLQAAPPGGPALPQPLHSGSGGAHSRGDGSHSVLGPSDTTSAESRPESLQKAPKQPPDQLEIPCLGQGNGQMAPCPVLLPGADPTSRPAPDEEVWGCLCWGRTVPSTVLPGLCGRRRDI